MGNFIQTESYLNLERFAKNDMFFNVFVFGPKGCGKTKTIEDIHIKNNKKLIRVNISIETDEDSLIGGFRLRNNETVLDKGPVLVAMEEGATLLLDEVDQGHPQRLMCLQSILEGSPYLIKRTNELVYPKPGFKVWATANTKGSGDDTGHYVGAQILNGAMKDRFSTFISFEYPTKEIEKSILMSINDETQKEFFPKTSKLTEKQIGKLVNWANLIRNNENEFEIDETISTRKLIDIVKCSFFYNDLKRSILSCINGYPSEYIDAFIKTYELLDDDGEHILKKSQKQYIKF